MSGRHSRSWTRTSARPTKVTKFAGGYVRDALKRARDATQSQGFNPYQFGFVGASDTHNAAGPFEESRYFSKVGIMDGTAEQRGSVPAAGPRSGRTTSRTNNAARYSDLGCVGTDRRVGGGEHARIDLRSLRRKETFATSGPRMRVRFFAGYEFPEGLDNRRDMVSQSYAHGVPMGADLAAARPAHRSSLRGHCAIRTPAGCSACRSSRAGSTDGKAQERVFDVACSDGLTPDSNTHRCADNGATRGSAHLRVSENKGAVELRTLWSDPDVRPAPARALLRSRAGESVVPLVDVGRPARRRRAEPEAREDDPGTRLELADLVRSAALRTRELCH